MANLSAFVRIKLDSDLEMNFKMSRSSSYDPCFQSPKSGGSLLSQPVNRVETKPVPLLESYSSYPELEQTQTHCDGSEQGALVLPGAKCCLYEIGVPMVS